MKTTEFPTAEGMRIISKAQVKKERVQKSVLRKVKRSALMGYKALLLNGVNLATWNFLESKGYLVKKSEKQPGIPLEYKISWYS